MCYFPNTIAVGKSFCNRLQAREQLKNHINSNVHTVILGTRRIGKSSLVKQVLLDTGYTSCEVDMSTAYSIEDIRGMLLKAISKTLTPILPTPKKALTNFLKILKLLNPEIILSAMGQQIRFNPRFDSGADSLTDILDVFDSVAVHLKNKIVLIMDEFQEVGRFSDFQIEASLRSSMQSSKNICYVFSGSNRQMLKNMFCDKKRPFYNSCDFINLGRIKTKEYVSFIKNAAQDCFDKELDEEIITHIVEIAENHTYYVNAICRHFWINRIFPTKELVDSHWHRYVEGRKSFYSSDFLALSINQKKIFSYFANNLVREYTSQDLCSEVKLSLSSARQSYLKLVQLDKIYLDKEDYIRLTDPGMKYYLNHISD